MSLRLSQLKNRMPTGTHLCSHSTKDPNTNDKLILVLSLTIPWLDTLDKLKLMLKILSIYDAICIQQLFFFPLALWDESQRPDYVDILLIHIRRRVLKLFEEKKIVEFTAKDFHSTILDFYKPIKKIKQDTNLSPKQKYQQLFRLMSNLIGKNIVFAN